MDKNDAERKENFEREVKNEIDFNIENLTYLANLFPFLMKQKLLSEKQATSLLEILDAVISELRKGFDEKVSKKMTAYKQIMESQNATED